MRYALVHVLLITALGLIACTKSSTTAEMRTGEGSPAATNQGPSPSGDVEKELERRLKLISDRANGTVGVSVVHIETGKTISINGKCRLPLYSVFKFPLAIAVLKDVEENRLRLDQKIHVTPAETVPGAPENTALWKDPADFTIAQLIDLSISRSDNTSSDKLLELVGGPLKVTERLRSLGFQDLDIHSTVAEFAKTLENPKHQVQNTLSTR